MKKNIYILLTTITIITLSILTGCSNPAVQGEPLATNGSGSVQFSWAGPGQGGGSRSLRGNVLSRANTIQDAKKVVITIEAADGTPVYSQKQLALYNFNGSFISEPISLKVGSYRLTEYLVLNQAGNVIFATPKEGSKKAHLVADPLPVNFSVTKDRTTKVSPEVVDTTTVTPADFGYATFSFAEAKVFNFLVSVMIYDASSDNFILTEAVMDVSTDTKSYSYTLTNTTNQIAINDLTGSYNLTIKKPGYEEHKATYTSTQLKAFFQSPLLITLTKKQAPVNKVITFADPGLEAAVREAIKKPTGDIYKSDVAMLTGLSAEKRNISNLSGIEHLPSLVELVLQYNHISDISHISALTKLTRLSLYSNKIIDISPLSSLTDLTHLSIGENSITDISSLSSLTNLRHLSIVGGNNITDISSLSPLTKLRHLQLFDNSITDISPLSSLTSLTSLTIDRSGLSEITALRSLTKLTVLALNENSISDLSPLSAMTKLELLFLNNNKISDLSPLSSLINLSSLYLQNNSISDITPLVNNKGFGNGSSISLVSNPLSTAAQNTHIPALKARGVIVKY